MKDDHHFKQSDDHSSGRGHDLSTSEARLNVTISRVLVAGLAVAVFLLLVGAILAAVRAGTPVARRTSFSDIARALAALEPGGFFDLGLLVLIATPVARVVALLAAFAHRRQWVFVGISAVVLVVLALCAFLGVRVE